MTEARVRRRPAFFRRQLIVDKKMQYSILAYSMAVSALTVLFILSFVAVLLSVPGSPTDPKYMGLMAALLFVSILVLSFLGIYVTNKVAGPIYRLRKSMQSISEGGSVEKIGFRKGDYFFDLADDYNKVLERLRKSEQK